MVASENRVVLYDFGLSLRKSPWFLIDVISLCSNRKVFFGANLGHLFGRKVWNIKSRKEVSVPQNGGTKHLISGYFGGGKLPLHEQEKIQLIYCR